MQEVAAPASRGLRQFFREALGGTQQDFTEGSLTRGIALLAVPTVLEMMMVWQLLQVRHIRGVPLIFVGPMWRELVGWTKKHMLEIDEPLASPADMDIPTCVDTVEAALEVLAPYVERFKQTAQKAVISPGE